MVSRSVHFQLVRNIKKIVVKTTKLLSFIFSTCLDEVE